MKTFIIGDLHFGIKKNTDFIDYQINEFNKIIDHILSVGVKNVLAKSKGSSNPHNLVKATFAALIELRDAQAVAQVRGVTVNKVFNG